MAAQGTSWMAGGSIAEDVTDMIYQITPTSKPLYNISEDGRSNGTLHQWQGRRLSTYASNAAEEGFAYSNFSEIIPTARILNICQILTKLIRVSGTNQAIDHYGISDYYRDQMTQRMSEWGTDAEQAIVLGTIATGATGTARRMQGICSAVAAHATSYTQDATAGGLTESKFNGQIQRAWDLGAETRDAFVKGNLKRKISSFTSSNTMFQKADERRVINSVGLYESDFFPVEIHLSRNIPGTVSEVANAHTTFPDGILMVDRTALKKAWLRRPAMERIPKTADSNDGVIYGEFTLEWGDPGMHSFYGYLATTP